MNEQPSTLTLHRAQTQIRLITTAADELSAQIAWASAGGYLMALYLEELIGSELLSQLQDETNQAFAQWKKNQGGGFQREVPDPPRW